MSAAQRLFKRARCKLPLRELRLHPPDTVCSLLKSTRGHMCWNKQGIFGQRELYKPAPTGKSGIDIGPTGHPCRMLDFERIMVKIAQAVERLALRVNPHYLMTRRFTGGREKANGGQ